MADRKKYTVALAGVNWRGRDHAINFLNNKDRFDLVAICDLNEELLNKRGDELSQPPYGGSFRRYCDAAAMLRECRPDVFCFATPPSIRLPLVRLGVEAGVRLIAYEKPMALDPTEAAEIDRITRQAGIKTTNAHIHRYGTHWQAMKAAVDEGTFGRIESMSASSLGWYFAYVTHLIDYLIWFNGNTRVKAVLGGHAHGGALLADPVHPSPDYVLGRLLFENGVHATVECGSEAPALGPAGLFIWRDAGVTIRGSDGWAEICTGTGWRGVARGKSEPLGLAHEFDQTNDGNQYVADIARWLDDDHAFTHPCNGDAVYHGFQVAAAILVSALEHRRVDLPLAYSGRPLLDRLKETLA